ncbi:MULTISPECIES: hypothetical protein [Klebsiella]|uniref:hypothetical protein n=1 Tax=Klebsiella TaxID=570 RepID=UPI000B9E92D3|nr:MULTISPECIES: hypothetical protein [Klebsiella]HCI6114365.1 hypothetical protein [Klebsiella quasipneumoniae subsp. similipneumoniae]EKQ1214000.1 hypothetical protein [Klebsiella pneumoniae]EKU4310086.1 hypothetical protein [Klebsiella pneumoniae]EKV0197470.1 hypothetical protein [Klebsiella pneumoniae]EKV6232184.1 hypothetical protein [Klebsiella pneumoniae]
MAARKKQQHIFIFDEREFASMTTPNPPLKIEIPSEMEADFISILEQGDIAYSYPVDECITTHYFTVNSAQDIIIEIVNSKALWGAIGYAICNLIHRNKHKNLKIELDDLKISASGFKPEDLKNIIELIQKIRISKD